MNTKTENSAPTEATIKTETLIRTIVTFFVLINSILAISGKEKLPWTEDEMYRGVSAAAALATTIWSWWRNNSFTSAAIRADAYMNALKGADRE